MQVKTFFSTLAFLLFPMFATAQSIYSPVIQINGSAVTQFEIQQRIMMLEVLGTVGDLEVQALDDLIDDRLRLQAGRALGVSVSNANVLEGMTEFAQRASMTIGQFLVALEQAGIYRETFEDFVRAGIVWRQVIQQRFQSKAFITEAELDTAVALGSTLVGASVLLAEIILPHTPETEADTLELMLELRSSMNSFADFEESAITYSASPSRAKGGLLDWTPIASLPTGMDEMLLTMGIGEITTPISLSGAYALFQLRGVRSNRTVAAQTIALDYASLLLPGGRSEETLKKAVEIAASVDTCNDLLAAAQDYPAENYSQQVVPVRQVNRSIALELSQLDQNEISTNLTSGTNGEFLNFIMLCGRTSKLSEGDREEVRRTLFTQRMEAFGEGYLQELMGDAIISKP